MSSTAEPAGSSTAEPAGSSSTSEVPVSGPGFGIWRVGAWIL